jgi:hypothetical protein
MTKMTSPIGEKLMGYVEQPPSPDLQKNNRGRLYFFSFQEVAHN